MVYMLMLRSANMSSYEYSSDSSTDEEFEEALDEVIRQQERDERAHALWDLFDNKNIESPISGPIDGKVLNTWLQANLTLKDVIYNGFLREQGKVALRQTITPERVEDFREAARAFVAHYELRQVDHDAYLDNVAACMIRYHYNL